MPGSYPEVIQACGELGFDGVELDVGADYADSMLWQANGRKEIERLLERAGIALASVCLGTFWTYSFASADASVRERAQAFTRDAIHWCRQLGAKAILVPVTPGAERENPEAARASWVSELRRLTPHAEQHQVCLAVENVGRGAGRTAEALLEIVEAVNSPYVKVYYDFGNGLSLGSVPQREIARLGRPCDSTEPGGLQRGGAAGWIAQVHAKDPGGEYMGEGWVNMGAVSTALKQVGYDGWLVLETPATDDPKAAAARNLSFTRERF
jgi:sugar phosphate isomerase/epimerase